MFLLTVFAFKKFPRTYTARCAPVDLHQPGHYHRGNRHPRRHSIPAQRCCAEKYPAGHMFQSIRSRFRILTAIRISTRWPTLNSGSPISTPSTGVKFLFPAQPDEHSADPAVLAGMALAGATQDTLKLSCGSPQQSGTAQPPCVLRLTATHRRSHKKEFDFTSFFYYIYSSLHVRLTSTRTGA